jgi:UDP-N-acetylmuramoyl-tripeptide--D-alanyl-D-alanine ligase
MKRTLAEFAQACGGKLEGADREYTVVSTDTRTIQAGELFVALQGPRFNANDFVTAAHKANAAAAVVDTKQNVPITQIIVPDTLAALTVASKKWRDQFQIPVVGVAGSNGKTTVKEMISSILSQAGNTLATRGNLNNHIGVPLTLFRFAPENRFAVVEIGTNHAGEVADLVKIATPAIGIITNAGAEHLEGFGSIEGVARAEGEMVEGLAPTGTAIINADDEFADLWRGLTRAKIVTFGVDKKADFSAQSVRNEIGPNGFLTRFRLVSPLGQADIDLQLAGKHNIVNALGAAAAAAAAGATLDNIVAGLAAVRAVKGRLQFKVARNGAWIIDDSYNANPSSVKAGIDVLAGLEGRKWLVIGDMAELGDFAESSHAEIGTYARERGIERMFATGSLTGLSVEKFGNGGQWFTDTQALAQALDEAGAPDVRMLIKGSRVNRLERVIEALVAGASHAGKTG